MDKEFPGLIPLQIMQNVFECWKVFQDDEVPIAGRPSSFEVSRDVLDNLVHMQFTSRDIATILGMSRSTICRQIDSMG